MKKIIHIYILFLLATYLSSGQSLNNQNIFTIKEFLDNKLILNSKIDRILLIDDYTKETFVFSRIDEWIDGSKISKKKIDNIIYLEKAGLYFKREYSGSINAKWFGAIGNGIKDDYSSIQKAIIFLEVIGKGNIYLPAGKYLISNKLIIRKPFIGIYGDGINNTIIKAENDCLQLSPYVDVSSASISNMTLEGNNSSTGIILKNSNFYFIDKIRISNFDIGVLGETAVLNKISNFYIIACNIGMSFSKSSYFTTLSNGTITACKKIGIIESGSRILIDKVDIEKIGGVDSGIAIACGSQTEIRDSHIESSYTAIGISTSGYVGVDNVFIGGCKFGIKQLNLTKPIYGNYVFRNIRFAGTEKEFELPTVYNCVIDTKTCFTSDNLGGNKKIHINVSVK